MPCLSFQLEYCSKFAENNNFPHHPLKTSTPIGREKTNIDSTMMTVDTDPVSPEWLGKQLTLSKDMLLLDCRSPNEYNTSHIEEAIHVTIPTLMLKRLKKGNLAVDSVIKCQKFHSKWRTESLVLYDQDTSDVTSSPNSVVALLFQRLSEEGCTVHYLNGGFQAFQARFSDLCIGLKDAEESSILGLRNLQIAESDPPQEEDAPSPTNPSPFPVEVLPHLFLGNAKNSGDIGCLYKNGIKYILNVTPNIPNTFEDNSEFHYMQIPINDHWSQNLAAFFPDAIAFIDEARQKQCGVLVHCLAGISRSVTLTVAYLMYRQHLSLNDAYDVVKKCKPNISPNFNFMGQLLDFEHTLGLSGNPHCGCQENGLMKTNEEHVQRASSELRICNCKKDIKTFFSSPTCTSSSVSSTSSMSSSSSLAMSSASSNTAFDYDIPPTPS